MKDNMHVNMTIKNGKLEFNIKALEEKYKSWITELPEGTRIEAFFSVAGEKGTKAQLARVHAMIRELANTLGYTFEDVKAMTKERSGVPEKSFADCDKEELNLVIQELIRMGDFTNTNLR